MVIYGQCDSIYVNIYFMMITEHCINTVYGFASALNSSKCASTYTSYEIHIYSHKMHGMGMLW